MIIRPGYVPSELHLDQFQIDGGASIVTSTRNYTEYWVDVSDHSRSFGPCIWNAAMLPIRGPLGVEARCSLAVGSVTFSLISTFRLLDKDGNVLYSIISTIEASADTMAGSVSDYSHGSTSLSNAFPDGLEYAGIVNGYSTDSVWSPATGAGKILNIGAFNPRPLRSAPKFG